MEGLPEPSSLIITAQKKVARRYEYECGVPLVDAYTSVLCDFAHGVKERILFSKVTRMRN